MLPPNPQGGMMAPPAGPQGAPMAPPPSAQQGMALGSGIGSFGGTPEGRRGFSEFLKNMAGPQQMPQQMPMMDDPMMMGPMMEPQGFAYGGLVEMAGGGAVPMGMDVRGQPHSLAYINPQESALLRVLGGSGEPGPGGIPMYYNDSDAEGDVGGDPGSADGEGDPGGDIGDADFSDPTGFGDMDADTFGADFGSMDGAFDDTTGLGDTNADQFGSDFAGMEGAFDDTTGLGVTDQDFYGADFASIGGDTFADTTGLGHLDMDMDPDLANEIANMGPGVELGTEDDTKMVAPTSSLSPVGTLADQLGRLGKDMGPNPVGSPQELAEMHHNANKLDFGLSFFPGLSTLNGIVSALGGTTLGTAIAFGHPPDPDNVTEINDNDPGTNENTSGEIINLDPVPEDPVIDVDPVLPSPIRDEDPILPDPEPIPDPILEPMPLTIRRPTLKPKNTAEVIEELMSKGTIGSSPGLSSSSLDDAVMKYLSNVKKYAQGGVVSPRKRPSDIGNVKKKMTL